MSESKLRTKVYTSRQCRRGSWKVQVEAEYARGSGTYVYDYPRQLTITEVRKYTKRKIRVLRKCFENTGRLPD